MLASLAFVVVAVAILLAAPGNEPASAASPLTGPRVIRTDAQHAVLALRAGYRVRIVQPASAVGASPLGVDGQIAWDKPDGAGTPRQ